MTDKQFQKSIDMVQKKLMQYHKSLEVAEKEYERRYGHHPSDVDNDSWIDAMHINWRCPLSVQEVKESAER